MGIATFNNLEFFKKDSAFKIGRQIVLVFFLIFSPTVFLNAQSKEGVEIYSYEQLTQNTSFKPAFPNYVNPEVIIPLITDLKSTVYISNGSVKVKGENPVRAYLDLNSLSKQNDNFKNFPNVELVKIYIENERDLFSKINIDNLSEFTKLKYIYIVCRVDCNQNQISNALISSLKNYVIIYSVEKQS